ncbi:MAG: FAD-dependent oxidoreductase, partial [Paracoccaceae bacterium]|nr:FAD-dependent oxidoreductase [Paracoccaceae bacterium]
MSDFDYDLFVIGGGSGGVRAARVAAQRGVKVALAEEDRYGGTCVIRGCVPKKLMVFASEYGGLAEEARAYGWDMQAGGFDWSAFRAKLHAELDRLEGIYRNILKSNGVETFDARATLVDPHTVELADGTRKTARHILLAMGGRPVKPDMPGAELAITSNEIFHLDALPKSILIIGGGYIACEFACILNGLGVEVTQYYRGAQVLRGFDDEARGLVAEEMRQDGIDLHLGTNILSLEREGAAIRTKATNGDEKLFDQVMFATGRAPNTADMGLEALGVHLGRGGQVIVDQYS